MPVRPLDNAAWGFPSSCYVCDAGNDRGLRIAFAHDTDAGEVTASFQLGPEFSGAPRYVHGGVVLAILDEAMAWAAIAEAGRFAVVQHTATTFERPVRVGEAYMVTAMVTSHDERAVTARAEVASAQGILCAKAHARLSVLSQSVAPSAIGDVTGPDTHYLRREP
ncbi:MAG: PaaI family thioesterase [Acidimicrobiales bacterium]